ISSLAYRYLPTRLSSDLAKVKKYLDSRAITYSLLTHEYSEGSLNTARAAHIDKSSLAKGVLVRDEDFHYTLCVLPSNKKILRHTLNQIFDRHISLVEDRKSVV